MSQIISFVTAKFDPSNETPNEINPIAGEALLLWLRERLLKQGYEVSEPAPEDWGWYANADNGPASYMLGASGESTETTADVEWIIQIHKARSLKDQLLGRNKLATDDPLCLLIQGIVRAEADFRDVAIDEDD